MPISRRTNRTVAVAAAAFLAFLAAVFVLVGPPQLLARSDSPGFCAGCHVMEEQHVAFMHAGAHRRNRCVDCHLPNHDVAIHYLWKSIDGLKDAVVFYSGRVPERIALSEHGAEVLQANCERCHEATVAMLMNKERKCWSCHRSLNHRRVGAVETL